MHYLFKRIAPFLILFALSESVHAQDNLALGKEALQQKSYDSAISYFVKAQKAAPRVLETNFYLGEAYRLKGVKDSAETFLQRAVDINETYLPGWSSLGTLMIKTGQWDKAAKVFAAATKVDKGSPAVSLAYGNAYLDVDSLDKAIVYFSKAKELNENLPDVYVGLAEAYGRQNIAVLAISNYQKAAELDSTSAVIRYKLGKAYYKARQYTDCVREFQVAISLDPTNDLYVFEVADIFYRAKLWRESALFFAKYVTLKKDNPVASDEYAKALYGGKFYKDALPVLEQAITLNPKAYDLKPMYAYSLYEAGESQKAIDTYKTLPADSLGYEEYLQLARSYARLKDTTNAVACFEKAMTINPAITEFAGELGSLYYGQKQFEKAAIQFDRRLKTDPNNFVALYYGGISFNMIGKNDTAKAYFKKYVELRPADLNGLFQLAQTYRLQDSIEIATKMYRDILTVIDCLSNEDNGKNKEKYNPTIIGVYHILAQIDYQEKEYLSAVENSKKAISYEPKEMKKQSEELHLFYAQMLNVARSVKTLSAEKAEEIRNQAIEEYQYVLKMNPKNATAKKELTQLQGN